MLFEREAYGSHPFRGTFNSTPRLTFLPLGASCAYNGEGNSVPYTLQNAVRFQVLKAASTKKTVFWDFAPCSLVEVYRRFRGACCL
jgi:hypothetical protein